MSYMHRKEQTVNKDRYIPKNILKYCGRDYPVIRSSWERIYFQWCDNNPSVLEWSSENIAVPYISSWKKRTNGQPYHANYYPDVWLKVIDRDGNIQIYLVEIKPEKETMAPRHTAKKNKKTVLFEDQQWATNQDKWNAALAYCEKRGWSFIILTEKHLISK